MGTLEGTYLKLHKFFESGNVLSDGNYQHKFSTCKPHSLRLITLVYGIAVVIVSTLLHYSVQPGVDNCNSMAGIVSTYTSNDYALGCHTLSYIQGGSLASGVAGVGIAIYGLLGKSKMK